MKAILITGVVGLGVIGGMTLVPNGTEYLKETIEVEKTVEVDALEVRIKDALEAAQASTTQKAQEAYDKVLEAEKKRIEDETKLQYIKEIEESLSPEWRAVREQQKPPIPKSYIEHLIVKTFPEDPRTALAIAWAESELNAKIPNWNDSHRGCKGSFGVFQIACLHTDDYTKLYNVEYNIKMARKIYDAEGWQPWGAYTDGRYKQYMTRL